MSSLTVCDMDGNPSGSFEIDEALLVLDKGDQAVQQTVVAWRAAQRAGTASTLSKGEVRGSNRKPWRQKGTGRARAGYRQSPLWRGGAVAFGPRPRDYRKRLPKKMARLAFRRVLSEKVAADRITVVEQLALPEAKTKAFVACMASLKVAAPVLFLVGKPDPALVRASRNVPGVAVRLAGSVNTYELLCYPRLVADKSAMATLAARLKDGSGNDES